MGERLPLRMLASGWLVIYCYPGAPKDGAPESHREDIRQHEAFSRRVEEFRRRAVSIAALSSQPEEEQIPTKFLLDLRHHLLLDPELALAKYLGLPTATIGGRRCYSRRTIIIREGRIERVLRSDSDPSRSPYQVEAWMQTHGW